VTASETKTEVPAASAIWAVEQVTDELRDQFSAAEARIAPLPARITTAGQQLLDADRADPGFGTAVEQWQGGAGQLDLMAESLTAAVAALASYTGGLSGPEPTTT
jgi:hypothetical protein